MRLMASIGLEMEPAQQLFFEQETVSPTSSYAQIRELLNDRSTGQRRNYAEQPEAVRPIVAKVIERRG